MANRLAHSLSAYLQAHADNPVDWWPWCDEAFAEARERDVPVFVSIGYAACHWCHVMAHESFEDEQIAAQLNRDFVAIKVDREERPDVDAVYMTATQAMTGQGGWPMSVFCTPDRQPFHAGTYFPNRPSRGMPSFPQVLSAVTEAWTQRRDEVISGAGRIVDRLQQMVHPPTSEPEDVDPVAAIAALARDFDTEHGGFGQAPKFPPSMVLTALLRAAEQPEDYPQAWPMARQTLIAMARGGIYDQLAGGFARYSVDGAWVVPHFEKMLYDNALLLGVYADAATMADRLGEDAGPFTTVTEQTVEWLLAEMRTEEGMFASSLDADSADDAGVLREGAFYVWTPAQLTETLGAEDADRAVSIFGVTPSGTFEQGASTLQLPEPAALDPDLRARLAGARSARPRPARDDKVIAAWNGWLIDALVRAGMTADRPDWVAVAAGTAGALRELHWADGRLRRSSRGGVIAEAPGTAEDYAAMALASARLATATGEADWLAWAIELLDVLRAEFAADDGGLLDTAADAERLLWRPRERSDNATPSGASTAVLAARLVGLLTGEARWDEWADAIAQTLWPLIGGAPRFAGWPLADAVTSRAAAAGGGPVEVAVALPTEREGDGPDLVRTAWREAPAGSVVVAGPPDAEGWALLAERPLQGGRPTAYVCRGFSCRLPVTDVPALRGQLAGEA